MNIIIAISLFVIAFCGIIYASSKMIEGYLQDRQNHTKLGKAYSITDIGQSSWFGKNFLLAFCLAFFAIVATVILL